MVLNVRQKNRDGENSDSIEFNDTTQFEFLNTVKDHSIILNKEAVRINSTNHIDRDRSIRSTVEAVQYLTDVFGEVQTIRPGVRYINDIDKTRISLDLGESVNWQDLAQKLNEAGFTIVGRSLLNDITPGKRCQACRQNSRCPSNAASIVDTHLSDAGIN